MGDSETLVAESSAVMSYNSAGYTNTGYADASTTAVPDASGCDPGMTGDYGASGASADAAYSLPGISDGNAYNVDPNAVMQHDQDPGVGAPGSGDHVAGSEYEVTGSSQAAGYNSMNGSVVSEAGNVPSTENVCTLGIGSEAAGQELLDGSAMSGEENRLWSIVKANSSDFGAWTALIEETEKLSQDNILKIRRVYDDFLSEFPLCYGYWKKYADHEARVGSMDKVVEVYERAVQGVTYSVDIWLHYCIFAINTYGDPETIRRLFERGLAYVGTDYLSFLLWDKYIEYEYMQQEWSRVAKIYTRILENPNQQLDRYFSSFKEFAASRPLSDLRTVEEVAAAAPSESGGEVKASEGEVQPDAAEQTSKHVSAGLTEAEELEQYIAVREEMYKKAKEFDSKIIDFESAIRRPYFHVKPLSVAELENWHNYLDFIEREGDFNKVCSCLPNHLSVKQGGSLISYMRGLPVTVVKLYERCLISCANYTEYWIRYVLCMEANGSMDLVENALARATQVFVKRLPEIHLFAARFKEQNGDIDGARSAYQLVHTEISPGLLEATIKHANMERRLGNLEDAFSLYEQAIAIEKGKEHSQTLPMLYAQYSRFLHLVSGNTEKARQVLLESLDHVQLSKPLLEALIHFESIQSPQKQIDYLEPLVDKFLMPNSDGPNTANAADREELSCIFLEFLGLFGDAQLMKKAEDRHARLFLPHRSSTELKKRHAEDFLASERAKMAKSYSGVPSPAQSLMGAYPSSQNPFAAGYGLQPPAWPPATPAPAPVPAQAQAQQWNSGYGQQAAYGAYSGYGSSYPAPQVSVPQNAAYGAYPPAYPAQAFPQQGYSQPTAAATVTPAQQPASVPQAYYGSYY